MLGVFSSIAADNPSSIMPTCHGSYIPVTIMKLDHSAQFKAMMVAPKIASRSRDISANMPVTATAMAYMANSATLHRTLGSAA